MTCDHFGDALTVAPSSVRLGYNQPFHLLQQAILLCIPRQQLPNACASYQRPGMPTWE